MVSTVGEAAKWTVLENEKVGPIFIRWRPFPGARDEAPRRLDERLVPDTAPDAEMSIIT